MSTRYSIGTMFAYLRRPYFPAGKDRIGEAQLKHLIQLLFFSLAMMIFVGGVVGAIITSVTGELPENANETIGQASPMMLLFYGVILAPLIEEVVFRSWLGGRLTCILGLPILVSFYAIAAAVSADMSPIVSFAVAGGLSVLVLGVARQFASLSPPAQKEGRWRLFPAAFYGSALLFALLHLSNYEGGLSSPIMLIAILPQFFVGLILGYVRMRFGLIHAILFHAIYNLVLISVFMLAQSLTPAVDSAGVIAHPPALTLVVTRASA
jgi:membrane protease YdiL (CAAX protease family)